MRLRFQRCLTSPARDDRPIRGPRTELLRQSWRWLSRVVRIEEVELPIKATARSSSGSDRDSNYGR
jgi:hypothetical protein